MLLTDTLKNWIRQSPLLERFTRQLLDRRYQLARQHLRGTGLEIGALDRPLYLPAQARAFYLDRLPPDGLREHYPELAHRVLHVSLVGDGESLGCIADGSLDFVVANHLIEHCEDPVGAMTSFASKLKAGGKLFLAVPDMRRTFDRRRSPTTWDHLLADHERGARHSRETHYREWAEAVEGRQDDDADRRACDLMGRRYSIHFHCWTRESFTDFLHRLASHLPLRIIAARSWRNENLFVLTRGSSIVT